MTLPISHLYGIDLIEICDPLRVLLDNVRELPEPVQAVLFGPASEFVLIGQCIYSHIRQAHVCTHCDACDGAHSDEPSNYATCAYFKPMKALPFVTVRLPAGMPGRAARARAPRCGALPAFAFDLFSAFKTAPAFPLSCHWGVHGDARGLTHHARGLTHQAQIGQDIARSACSRGQGRAVPVWTSVAR